MMELLTTGQATHKRQVTHHRPSLNPNHPLPSMHSRDTINSQPHPNHPSLSTIKEPTQITSHQDNTQPSHDNIPTHQLPDW